MNPDYNLEGVWLNMDNVSPQELAVISHTKDILLASDGYVLGVINGYNAEHKVWFINSNCYNGDPPTHWIIIPAAPR